MTTLALSDKRNLIKENVNEALIPEIIESVLAKGQPRGLSYWGKPRSFPSPTLPQSYPQIIDTDCTIFPGTAPTGRIHRVFAKE